MLTGHTDDQHHGSEFTALRGLYWTLEEPNAAARTDLLDEWDDDFFESHEITEDEDGMVNVEATCPEGEIMCVYIEQNEAPSLFTFSISVVGASANISFPLFLFSLPLYPSLARLLTFLLFSLPLFHFFFHFIFHFISN